MKSAKERRAFSRHPCYGIADVRIKTGSHLGSPHVALICDIGVKGMCLSMDRPLAQGAQIQIAVPGRHEFIGIVCHVRHLGRECILGIRFTAGEWNEQSEWPRRQGAVAPQESTPDQFVAADLAMM